MAACAGLRPGARIDLESTTKTVLRSLAGRIQRLQEEIKALDAQLTTLVQASGAELLELCGVATQVASTLLISIGDNPERLADEAALARLWGVCPIPAFLGPDSAPPPDRGGDRQANAALYRILIVRMRFHEPTKRYVEPRTKEGKTKKEIIRCLKRYVAREIFAVIQRTAGH